MKILITGATGFIGNHLINQLLKDKNNEIIATSTNLLKAKNCKWFEKVKYIPYDISTNSNENLFEFFNKPDILIHLAWNGLPNYNSLIHIEKNLYENYYFIKNLVSNGLKEVVATGTCFEYGLINGPLSEDLKTDPSNSYSIAKDSLHRFLVQLKNSFVFDYKWIRLFYMHGEGQNEKSLLPLLRKAINEKQEVFNMSKGDQLRDYLSIEDVVRNIELIAKQNIFKNEAINCCSGKSISVREIVEEYLAKNNYNIKLNLGYYDYSPFEPMSFWGDDSKLKIIKREIDE